MKKVLFISLLLVPLSFMALAQGPEKSQCPDGNDWFQRMRSEKIAFLTAEMELTPEEAQLFWPVYNEYQAQELSATKASREAFKALGKAVSSKLGEKEIEKLISQYVEADASRCAIVKKYLPEFTKVLSAEKIAKLYLAEEKFRMSRIYRLRDCRNDAPAGKEGKKQCPGNPGYPGGPSMEMRMLDE